jgi:hypothetical protein
MNPFDFQFLVHIDLRRTGIWFETVRGDGVVFLENVGTTPNSEDQS